MAISRGTLTILRRLIITVGQEADQSVRSLTTAWTRAWDELAPAWRLAIGEIVAQAVATGRWPAPWELRRTERLLQAALASQDALIALGRQTGITVTDAAGRVIRLDADIEPRIIASQLPAAERPAALVRFAGRIGPTALDVIVARTTGQITSTVRPLAPAAYEQMQRVLVQGVVVGDHPTRMARDMLDRTQGAFNGGLTRATNIARTETLDAYRAASGYVHAVNRDVLGGWQWLSTLDSRTCISCWSMHGRTFPLDQPGPWDHQSGRCARCPKALSWAELGFTGIQEPPDALPDARARFDALPVARQRDIAGPGRLDALRAGRISWDDLAVQRQNPGWRPSYVPTPVRDVPREAAGDRRTGLLVVG